MLSLDESLDENTSSSNTKFFFPLRLGLLLLYSGMLMVMFVRALNVEAGSSIFVFKDAISGTVLVGWWIVSSADLVGSTGRAIVEVSFPFLWFFWFLFFHEKVLGTILSVFSLLFSLCCHLLLALVLLWSLLVV